MTKQSGITGLLESAAWPRGTSTVKMLTPAKLVAVTADLRQILAAAKQGKAIPSKAKLGEYFTREYGVPVSRDVVSKWLRIVSSGQTIS